MIELRKIQTSCAYRFRNAVFVGLASASAIAVPPIDAQAGWWSTPTAEKSADDPETKSPAGSRDLIRKLMKEAKAEEDKGNLDRAIALADRALRLSERSSNVTASIADISPTATSRYANDLRMKKAEKSEKRVGKKPVKEPAAGVVRAPARPKPDVKADSGIAKVTQVTPPPSKKQVIAKSDEKTPDRKDAGKDRPSAVAAAPAAKKKPQPAATVPSKTLPIAGADSTKNPIAKTAKPKIPSQRPDDVIEEKPPVKTAAAPQKVMPKMVAKADNDVKATSFDDEDPPHVSPMPPLSTKADRNKDSSAASAAAPLKLRPQYASSALVGSSTPGSTTQPAAITRHPTITPMANTANFDDTLSEPGKIVPTSAEEDPAPNAKAAISFDDDFELSPPQDAVEKPATVVSKDEFPVDKVRELKRRLDSATSLEPGAVAPIATPGTKEDSAADFASDDSSNEDEVTTRLSRLRKRQNPQSKSSVEASEPVRTDNIRQPIVGRASMIQWRSAKEESAVAPPEHQPESKSPRLPEDLRQSLRENAGSKTIQAEMDRQVNPDRRTVLANAGFTNTAETPSRTRSPSSLPVRAQGYETDCPGSSFTRSYQSSHQVRGSLWDHATAPSADRDSTVTNGVSNAISFDTDSSTSAPMPPSRSTIEQVSLDSAPELFHRNRHPEMNHESASTSDNSGFSGSMSIAPLSHSEDGSESLLTSAPNAPSNCENVRAQAVLANGPIERLAFVLGVSVSAMSAILGVGGLAAFFAGLWMARATVQSKSS